MERLWKVILHYRDHTSSKHDIIALTFDEAVQEAMQSSGRKPIWVSNNTNPRQQI